MALIYTPLEIHRNGKGTGLYRMCVHSDEEHWPAYAVGHPTKEEAHDHWMSGEAEKISYRVDADTQKKCQICGAWTQYCILVGDTFYKEFYLCDEHKRPEIIKELFLNEDIKNAI